MELRLFSTIYIILLDFWLLTSKFVTLLSKKKYPVVCQVIKHIRTSHRWNTTQLAFTITITTYYMPDFICFERLVKQCGNWLLVIIILYRDIRMDLLWTKVLALCIVGLGSGFSGLAALPVRLEFIVDCWLWLNRKYLYSEIDSFARGSPLVEDKY